MEDKPWNPFGALASAAASALEAVLDGAFPGQLQLIAEAERIMRDDEQVQALIGSDVTIGEIDAKESMSVSAGVQVQAVCSGSKGSGVVIIGGARDDDEDSDGGLILQLLRVKVGSEDFYVVEP